jgi:AsmA protein
MISGRFLTPFRRVILRRIAIAIGVLGLLAFGAAIALIATRDYASLERGMLARLERETGLQIRYDAHRQVLWPKPKIVFDRVSMSRLDGALAIEVPQAIVNFGLIDLINGAVDEPAILFSQPEIRIAGPRYETYFRSPRTMTDALDVVSAAFDASGFKGFRLTLSQAKMMIGEPGATPPSVEITPVDARLRYSKARDRIELLARRETPSNPLELSLSLPTRHSLSREKARAASIRASGYQSSLFFSGEASRDPDPSLMGRLDINLGEELEHVLLSSVQDKRGQSGGATKITANFRLDPRGIGLEQLMIAKNAKQLSGIAALREIGERWSVSATLAGDLVDGTAAHRNLQQLRLSSGQWSEQPLALQPLPAIDLDIRLSTQALKLANVILDNVALSILTRRGRAEFSIVDSRFRQGTVKARVSIAENPDGAQDFRLNASGERVAIGALLENATGFHHLSGEGSIVVQVEGKGVGPGGIVRSLSGSAAVEIHDGEIAGIDLSRLMARSSEGRPETALVLSLAGRTAFEILRGNFAVKNGRIEPIGTIFTSARVNASLEGAIDLGVQRHDLSIILRRRIDEPGKPGEFYAFRLDGPLFSPNLKPDLKILLNRN